MGLFTRVQPCTSCWKPFSSLPVSLGALVLSSGGQFAIGPFRFDQSSEIEDCTFGEAKVHKKAGEGAVLQVDAPKCRLRLKYEGERWWHLQAS